MHANNVLTTQPGRAPQSAENLSKLVTYPPTHETAQNDSFKYLAHLWDVRVAASFEAPLGLCTLGLHVQVYPTQSKVGYSGRTSLDILTISLWSKSFGKSDSGGFLILVICTFGKETPLSLLGYACLQTSSLSIIDKDIHKVTLLAGKSSLRLQPRWRASVIITGVVVNFIAFAERSRPRQHILARHQLGKGVKSLFGFLKYSGPRRLRSSRKILLDEHGYQITHIGQGAFAVISRVLYRPTGEVRVMKRITFDDTGLAEYLAKNEVNTLKAMNGNIWFPPFLNDFAEGGQFVVTMPFYRRGDLAAFIEHKRHLGREVAQFYSAQLVLAIQSLHKVGIIHRDIKTDNIFLDEEGHLVLADLGLAENIATIEGGEDVITARYPEWMEARTKGGDDFPFLWVGPLNPLGMRGIAGTFWYTAPEVFRKERYSFGVDYWAVGVIYHELITGHIPFNHFKPYPEDKRPVLDFRRKPGQLKDINPWEERELRELLAPYPPGRPKSLTDIKKSHIFNGVDWEKMSRKEISPPLLPPPLKEDSIYPYSL